MKARIIGSILVILVVAGLYFVTESSKTPTPQTTTPQFSSPSDDSFRGLKIN